MYSKLKRTAGAAVRLHKSVTHGIRSRTDPLLIGESFAFLSFFLGCICECNQRVKYFYLNVHLISSAVVVNPLTHSTPLWPAICHFLLLEKKKKPLTQKTIGKSSSSGNWKIKCRAVLQRSAFMNRKLFSKRKKKAIKSFSSYFFIISPVK